MNLGPAPKIMRLRQIWLSEAQKPKFHRSALAGAFLCYTSGSISQAPYGAVTLLIFIDHRQTKN